MAKWGEGDPRWIVEERPDATNVNNWHWTEKRASEWSKCKLSELLMGLKIHTEAASIELTEILKCDGDAVVINRKGKLLYFYEWNLEMKWKGETHAGVVVEGHVSVPYLSEEYDMENTDIYVRFQEDGAAAFFGNIMQNEGVKAIRGQLLKYVAELKGDFAKDLLLSTPNLQQSENNLYNKTQTYSHWLQGEQDVPDDEMDCKFEADHELSLKETFKCTPEELFRALTIQELVQAYTKSDCTSESVEGGKFQHFGGNVQGYFVTLQPFHTIVLKWRFISWPKDHFSDVFININPKSDCTELDLKQFGIPKGQKENTEEGWKRHYWDSMKKYFGFGAFLF